MYLSLKDRFDYDSTGESVASVKQHILDFLAKNFQVYGCFEVGGCYIPLRS